jgi:hypothetical protein
MWVGYLTGQKRRDIYIYIYTNFASFFFSKKSCQQLDVAIRISNSFRRQGLLSEIGTYSTLALARRRRGRLQPAACCCPWPDVSQTPPSWPTRNLSESARPAPSLRILPEKQYIPVRHLTTPVHRRERFIRRIKGK